ncbi:MAG: hypothetical protein KA028_00450 [Candidatus Pacebacteria bacterium]|nr:hypothetical protein [Candidatus Paceibacterota bacterium]MBP9851974.1 hypothetical protein [Candidatus Paceibacterota bacterium]
MENNNMEGFNANEIDNRIQEIHQIHEEQYEPLKEQIMNTTDFAQKGLLIERFNEMAKKLGKKEHMVMNENEEAVLEPVLEEDLAA